MSDLSAGKYKKKWEEINWKQSRIEVYLSPPTTLKSNPKKLSAETGLKLSKLQTKESLFKPRLHKLGAFSFLQKSALEGKFDLFVLVFPEPVLLLAPCFLFLGTGREYFLQSISNFMTTDYNCNNSYSTSVLEVNHT